MAKARKPLKTANLIQIGGDHYNTPIQHWDFVIANGVPYMEAQIMKYLLRWRQKGGVQDLKKAQHFLDKLMEVNKNYRVPTGE